MEILHIQLPDSSTLALRALRQAGNRPLGLLGISMHASIT